MSKTPTELNATKLVSDSNYFDKDIFNSDDEDLPLNNYSNSTDYIKYLKNMVHAPFEIWSSAQANHLLRNRHIVFLGDSVQRCAYIDLVKLLEGNELTDTESFKKGHTHSFGRGESQDSARTEGKKEELNSFSYFQLRNYINTENNTRFDFYFMSRCFSEYVYKVFQEEIAPSKPDLVVMSCMFYDMSFHHYGKNAAPEYFKNLYRLKDLVERLGIKFLWREATPLGEEAYGGFMQRKKACNDTLDRVVQLREDIPIYCKYLEDFWTSHNFEYLPVHDYFCTFPEEREKDDIHWKPFAHRVLSFLMLTKFRRIWEIPRLPFSFLPEMVSSKKFIRHPSQIDNLEGARKLRYYMKNAKDIFDYEGERVFQNCEVQFNTNKSVVCQKDVNENKKFFGYSLEGNEDNNDDWVTDYSTDSDSSQDENEPKDSDKSKKLNLSEYKKLPPKKPHKYQLDIKDILVNDQMEDKQKNESKHAKDISYADCELSNRRQLQQWRDSKSEKCANEILKDENFGEILDENCKHDSKQVDARGRKIHGGDGVTERMFNLVFDEGEDRATSSQKQKDIQNDYAYFMNRLNNNQHRNQNRGFGRYNGPPNY